MPRMPFYPLLALRAALVCAIPACAEPPEAPPRSLLRAPSTARTPTREVAPAAAGATAALAPADQAASASERPSVPIELPPADGIFRWVEGEPEFLDPNKVSESVGSDLVSNLFEPLLNIAPGNEPPRPGVAERYEVSDDGRTYTFHLRKNARWSNGRAVTSADFVYAWRRALAPATASKSASNLWFVKNAQPFNEGTLREPEAVGVRALDDWTLAVELEAPTPFFPHLAAYPAYAPVPREAIEAHGDQWTRPEHIVTNGPFVLAEWAVRDRIVLHKSATYWDAASVKLDGAIHLHSESEDHAHQLYEAGKVHWTPAQVPVDKIPLLLTEGRTDFHIDPILCVAYFYFRLDRHPLDDARVRRAIVQAVDRERITKHILRGGQVPATHLVPPTLEPVMGYRGPTGPGFDPTAAAALLAEAGYPRGEGVPALRLTYNTYEANRLIADAMQRSTREVLGVELVSENMEWKSLLKLLQAGDFHVGRGGWCADYPDPMTFLAVFHSSNPQNHGGFENAAFDALVDAAKSEADAGARNALMARAEQLLIDEAVFLPLYFYTRAYMLKPYVTGFVPQYQDNHLLKYLAFRPAGG